MFDFQMVSKLYSRQKLNTNASVHVDPSQPVLEQSLFMLFKINLVQLIKNKVALVKHFYVQPSEVERMPYWEYELFLEEVNTHIKEENKQAEEQKKQYNPDSYKKQANSMMPKTGNISMPKINVNMPTF